MKPSPLPIALRHAADALSHVSDSPRLDAELLMAYALGMDRSDMLLRQRDLSVPAAFPAMLARRRANEPVAYIIGLQHFWDLQLAVTPAVLIPRADSELLIEIAIQHFSARAQPKAIIDLGTGSGALILAALSAFSGARGIGIDASQAALDVADGNRFRCGFAERLSLQRLDWRDADWTQAATGGPFDLLLCNPPYVEQDADLSPMVRDFEPGSALFAGADGLGDYRLLIPAISRLMAGDALAVFEIGATQADAVGVMAQAAGFDWQMHRDIAGKPRALALRTGSVK